MKIPAVFLLAATAVSIGASAATPPIFDVPRLDGIVIDGKGADWGDRGFRVETLAGNAGMVYRAQDIDAGLRLGWDDRGLLVLVTVHDDHIEEAETPDRMIPCDSVEMFLSAQLGSPAYFQLVAGPIEDAKAPGASNLIRDRRVTAAAPALAAESACTRTADGYVVEARIPWASAGIQPALGAEVAFQLAVNDTDPGSQVKVTWFPSDHTIREAKDLQRLRLADKPGRPIRLACVTSVDLGRPRLDVVAPNALTGREVAARAGGKVIATGLLQSIGGHARTTLAVPPGDIELTCGEEAPLSIDGRWFNSQTGVGIDNARVVFKPWVFSGEQFPPYDFETPGATEKALGKCRIAVTYYDAEQLPVQKAAKAGRYGAIVHVTPENGWPFTRFVTLYRMPAGLNWQLANIDVPPFPLPAELELDPRVVREQSSNIGAFVKEQLFFPRPNYGEQQAILLAGLSEAKATGGKVTARTGPRALDKQWWFELKKKTSDLRTDYYVRLPASYETAPEKKWPLVLFLHGSGQRGDKLNQILVTGLVQDLDQKPDFPAIVVAPQCASTEDWSSPELNDLLDRVEAKYRIDLDRVYLTGLSMGGFGAWALAIDSPERFAAVVPICGGGDTSDVERLKKIPIWVFHGANDNIVSPQHSQRMVDALQAVGGNVKFTLFPNTDHGSWNKAYAMPELYEWLWQQRRPEKTK